VDQNQPGRVRGRGQQRPLEKNLEGEQGLTDPVAVADAMIVAFKQLAAKKTVIEYSCPQCPKRFPDYLKLTNHYWSIHGEAVRA
jgi:hypothetical protein